MDGGNRRDAIRSSIRASSRRRPPLRLFVPPERSRRHLPAPPAPPRRDVVSHRPKQPRPLLDRLQRGEDLAARERLLQLVSQLRRPPGVSRRDAVVADEIVGASATAEGAEGAVDPSAGHRARRSHRALFRAPQSLRRLVLVLVGVVLMRSRVRHEGLDHVRRDLHHLAQLADLPLKPGDLAADPDERLVVREDVLPLLGLGEIAQRRELVAQMPHAPLGGVAVELRGETVEVEILRVILGPWVEGLAQLGHRGRGHRGRLCGHRCQLSNIWQLSHQAGLRLGLFRTAEGYSRCSSRVRASFAGRSTKGSSLSRASLVSRWCFRCIQSNETSRGPRDAG